MTDERIENVWRQYVLPAYRKNERHRLYAITPESKRQWVALFRACRDTTDSTEQAQELFGKALEQIHRLWCESFATVVAVFGLRAWLLPACVGRWLICLLSFLWLSVAYLVCIPALQSSGDFCSNSSTFTDAAGVRFPRVRCATNTQAFAWHGSRLGGASRAPPSQSILPSPPRISAFSATAPMRRSHSSRLPRKRSSQAVLKLSRAIISRRFPLFVSLTLR
jgi:hypothetical protein